MQVVRQENQGIDRKRPAQPGYQSQISRAGRFTALTEWCRNSVVCWDKIITYVGGIRNDQLIDRYQFIFGHVFTYGGSKQQLTESAPKDSAFQLPIVILMVNDRFDLGQWPLYQGGVY